MLVWTYSIWPNACGYVYVVMWFFGPVEACNCTGCLCSFFVLDVTALQFSYSGTKGSSPELVHSGRMHRSMMICLRKLVWKKIQVPCTQPWPHPCWTLTSHFTLQLLARYQCASCAVVTVWTNPHFHSH